jgi:hypothetical protein
MPVSRPSQRLWFERLMAIVATANLGLVIFDLSYVPWRDFWLQGKLSIPLTQAVVYLPMPPQITVWYDPIKGIEPHRETQLYLETVQQLQQQKTQLGLTSPQVQATLQSLRSQSNEMIETNPFQIANKSGTLEKIKNKMRIHIFGTPKNTSARQAFNRFWSPGTLTTANWDQQLDWFNTQIVPLIQTNYYRSLSESGEFTDNFGRIDLPFNLLFALEFLGRTFYISRRHRGLLWRDAMLWRWYDGLLFFPFWLVFPNWAWLRVFPVGIRLHQAKLVNMERLRQQLTQGVVASLAQEMSEAVVLQLLGQVQVTLRRSDLGLGFLQAQAQSQSTPSHTDELMGIANLILKMTLEKVLPQLKPDLVALLGHNLEQVLRQSPGYSNLKSFPGLETLPSQLSQRLATEIINALQEHLPQLPEDAVGTELTLALLQHLRQAFFQELQQQEVLQEIQDLLSEMLEEIKASYRSPQAEAALISEPVQIMRRKMLKKG